MARLLIFTLLIFANFARAQEPIILIMVDGARPDYIDHFISQGSLPNIKKYFYDEGSVFQNSFTSMSLTVPSWSAILSGRDVDRTTIKGNDIFNRTTKEITNYLDWRVDILHHRDHGRAYSLLRNGGHKTMIDYFQRPDDGTYGMNSEVYATFFPLNDRFPMYLAGTSIDNLLRLDAAKQVNLHTAAIRLIYEGENFSALDRDNVDQVIKVINDKRSPAKKLILIYFASVDHYAHFEHGKGTHALELVDPEIGRIMRAIKRSRYHNATVGFVSDHGSQGGQEFSLPNSHHPFKGFRYGLTLTNINSLLSGRYNIPGMQEYAFNVTSTFANEGKFSLRNWSEFQLHPFQCTNVARIFDPLFTCEMFHKLKNGTSNENSVHAAVTTTQTMALPFARAYSGNWSDKNNWYTLTNYEVGPNSRRNIIKDLENFEIPNVKILEDQVEGLTSKFPLDWLAIAVSKENFNASALSATLNLKATQDLLLVHHADNSQALIVANDRQEFRYIPIQNFSQNAGGEINFTLNEVRDPFGYLQSPWVDRASSGNFIEDALWFNEFHSPREWAARYAQTTYPNAVFATYRTFHYRQEGLQKQATERFDILLNPKYGHIFTVENDDLEAQHGMFQRESVRNTFMLRGPNIRKGYMHMEPVFSVDVLPTLFRASGKSTLEEIREMDLDGESIEPAFR